MRAVLLLGVAVALNACATHAQRQAKNIENVIISAKNEAFQCIKTVDSDPRYSSIVANASSNGLPTLQQLSNQNVPGPAEGPLILSWRQARDNCMQQPLQEVAGVAPNAALVLQENMAKVDDIFLDLSKGKYSWGQAMAEVKQTTLASSAKVNEVAGQMQSELQAENREELDRRAAAAAAFGQALQAAGQSMQQQQIINQQQQLLNRPIVLQPPPPMPVHTFCNQIGSFTNCTSQ